MCQRYQPTQIGPEFNILYAWRSGCRTSIPTSPPPVPSNENADTMSNIHAFSSLVNSDFLFSGSNLKLTPCSPILFAGLTLVSSLIVLGTFFSAIPLPSTRSHRFSVCLFSLPGRPWTLFPVGFRYWRLTPGLDAFSASKLDEINSLFNGSGGNPNDPWRRSLNCHWALKDDALKGTWPKLGAVASVLTIASILPMSVQVQYYSSRPWRLS